MNNQTQEKEHLTERHKVERGAIKNYPSPSEKLTNGDVFFLPFLKRITTMSTERVNKKRKDIFFSSSSQSTTHLETFADVPSTPQKSSQSGLSCYPPFFEI
jgi:hypothetical protein